MNNFEQFIQMVDDAIDSGKIRLQFWVCPDHERAGRVDWDGPVARCVECGRTNESVAAS